MQSKNVLNFNIIWQFLTSLCCPKVFGHT